MSITGQPSPVLSRRRLWLWLIPLLAFVSLAVLLGSRLGHDPAVQVSATTGKPLPVFQLPDLADGTLRTVADLPKTPFILNVWGSWCPSCLAEHPMLTQLAATGVSLVGVNYKDQPADALAYLAKNGNPFRLNLQDQTGSLGLDLGLTGAPESFVIDAQGRVRLHVVGVIEQGNWTTQIKPCLDALQHAKQEQDACPVMP
jgi:cytochrome c biogenesis protein CcmG/thiol:disulfide interchange protein DsbE